jgi:hypothetical protein
MNLDRLVHPAGGLIACLPGCYAAREVRRIRREVTPRPLDYDKKPVRAYLLRAFPIGLRMPACLKTLLSVPLASSSLG